VNKNKLFNFGALGALGIIVSAVNLSIGIFLIKILWSTIAEALFSKLVASGQISTSMPWKDAFWIGLFLYAVIRAFAGNLIKVTKKGNSTTVSLGDSDGTVHGKDSKDKKD
jgi:hypothetical protein